MNVLAVDFFLWNRAQWRDDLTLAVEDYLRRSGEEITLEEEWTVLNAAMLGQNAVQLLVALDGETLLGFAVLRAMPGTKVTGTTINIWQAYVHPKRARLEDLFEAAYSLMAQFAIAWQATRFTLSTYRMSGAYERVLDRIGFRPYLRTYTREVFTHGGGDEGSLRGGPDHGLRPDGEGGDVRPDDSGAPPSRLQSGESVRGASDRRNVDGRAEGRPESNDGLRHDLPAARVGKVKRGKART